MKLIAQIVVILLPIVSIVGFAVCYFPVQVTSEYSTKMFVDKSDKIENTISNVVSDLRKRDFVPVYLEVNWDPARKTYVIYARGIDRTKLGKTVFWTKEEADKWLNEIAQNNRLSLIKKTILPIDWNSAEGVPLASLEGTKIFEAIGLYEPL